MLMVMHLWYWELRPPGVLLLPFNTHTGRTYTVERLDLLRPTNAWVTFTNVIPGTNGPVTVSDPQAPAGYFYRLKVTRN